MKESLWKKVMKRMPVSRHKPDAAKTLISSALFSECAIVISITVLCVLFFVVFF